MGTTDSQFTASTSSASVMHLEIGTKPSGLFELRVPLKKITGTCDSVLLIALLIQGGLSEEHGFAVAVLPSSKPML